MKKNIKLAFVVALITFSLGSCWAPRCPIDSCLVEFEHVHSAYVSGVFSGRNIKHPPKLHFPWDGGNKGELNPDTDLKTVPGRKKLRKKFPWERW